MDIRSALKSQYHAAVKTLREVIEKCPEAMWNDPSDDAARFWRVAYHTLFYTHFYLQQDQSAFTPWSRHRDEAQVLGSVSLEIERPPKACKPFTRDELLEYCDDCDGMIDAGVDALDLSAQQCGFPWYKMPTLEHQIVNIRHIQHHAAALSSRLRRMAGIGIDWVGKG
jgi:DinB superfamily